MHFAIAVLQHNRHDDAPAETPPRLRGQENDSLPPRTLDGFFASAEQRAFQLARYALRDREAALDAVQDSMLKMVERYAHKPSTEWPALFFTIVQHRVTDMQRFRRVRERLHKVASLFGGERDEPAEDLVEAVADTAHAANPEQVLVSRRQRVAIDCAVGQLPERQRQVFLLREGQELSVKETAQVLGCTEGTVKQHHFRALQALRRLLAEEHDHA